MFLRWLTSKIAELTLATYITHRDRLRDWPLDAGATWTDLVDGNGTLVANGTVNVNVPGSYVLTYFRTDGAGNVAVTVGIGVAERSGLVAMALRVLVQQVSGEA